MPRPCRSACVVPDFLRSSSAGSPFSDCDFFRQHLSAASTPSTAVSPLRHFIPSIMIEISRHPAASLRPELQIKVVGLGGAGLNALDRIQLDGLDLAEL